MSYYTDMEDEFDYDQTEEGKVEEECERWEQEAWSGLHARPSVHDILSLD